MKSNYHQQIKYLSNKIGNQELKIVGVVKAFNLLSPEVNVPPMAFYHIKALDMAAEMNLVYVKLKSEDI